jgi:hypothetical protein
MSASVLRPKTFFAGECIWAMLSSNDLVRAEKVLNVRVAHLNEYAECAAERNDQPDVRKQKGMRSAQYCRA